MGRDEWAFGHLYGRWRKIMGFEISGSEDSAGHKKPEQTIQTAPRKITSRLVGRANPLLFAKRG
jgi:hypothetical protein